MVFLRFFMKILSKIDFCAIVARFLLKRVSSARSVCIPICNFCFIFMVFYKKLMKFPFFFLNFV